MLIKLSRGHGVLQWCFHAIFCPGSIVWKRCLFVYFLIRRKWCTLTASFCGCCVVEAKVKHLLALPSLCCCAVSATLSLFVLGAIYSVNLPQHRPRNVKLCCCLSPSIILGHCQREREMASKSSERNREHDGIISSLVRNGKTNEKGAQIQYCIKTLGRIEWAPGIERTPDIIYAQTYRKWTK